MKERCQAIRKDGGQCRKTATYRVRQPSIDGQLWMLVVCAQHLPWFDGEATMVADAPR